MVDGLPATRKPLHEKVTYIMGVAWQQLEKKLYEKVSDGGWLTRDQKNLYMKR